MISIAISGFGRIGRNFLRALLADPAAMQKLRVVAINLGPLDAKLAAHLFKYDTLLGTYPGEVGIEEDSLHIDHQVISLIAQTDPKKCRWHEYGVDWVIESSGKATHRPDAVGHLEAGAGHVLISAPASDEDVAIILGVNEEQFDRSKHKIISIGSCTSNAIIPLIKVLDDAFSIQSGFMTTTHSYTNSQVLLDGQAKDMRLSRAAALNIIPTTTGAAKMIYKIIPSLQGKIETISIRVPVAKVSLIDFTVELAHAVSIQQLHTAFEKEMAGRMKKIVALTMEECVSSDFAGNNYSVIIDGKLTSAHNRLAKIFGWYDNEWAYSVRLKDFLLYATTGSY